MCKKTKQEDDNNNKKQTPLTVNSMLLCDMKRKDQKQKDQNNPCHPGCSLLDALHGLLQSWDSWCLYRSAQGAHGMEREVVGRTKHKINTLT